MTSGPLVGRDAELRALRRTIEAALAGRPRVVAICGEAGIGKSRLAREALRSAAASGFRALESTAGRLHRDLSYAPLVEALRPLVNEPALVEGLSDLARLFDGVRVPPLVALGDPGLERTRMFEAVRRLVERATVRTPLVMLIDDVHWADSGSIAMLHYLVRALPRRRFLVLITYRGDEAGEELRELLIGLGRADALTTIELTGLDAAAVVSLAALVLGGPAPAALADMLVRRSGGVPLFVRAIIARLIETSGLFRSAGRWVLSPRAADEVPALVSALLRNKIEGLPSEARGVLDLLAVCGGAAEHVLLENIADHLVEGVNGLRAGALVLEESRGGSLWYRVAHPVLAEAAYDMMPLLLRRRLHAALARAVERHRPDDVLLLAAHVRGAGDEIDGARALNVLTAATRVDLGRRAGEEACASARAGLQIGRRLGRSEAVDELAGAYAEACELAGRVEDAHTGWLDAASNAADPGVRVRRLIRAAAISWELGRFAEAEALLDDADGGLAKLPPGPVHVDVVEARVRFIGRSGDFAALDECLARLANLRRAGATSRTRAVTVMARMGRSLHTGRYVEGLEVAQDVVAVAGRDELLLAGEALLRPLTLLHMCWGDLVGARAAAQEGIRLARQTGVPALEILHRTLLAFVDMLAGDWSAALRGTSDEIDLAQRLGSARGAALALAGQGMVLVRYGRLDEAADRAGDARRIFGRWSAADRHVFSVVDLVDGQIALGRHEVDRALEIAVGGAADHPSLPPLALALLGEAQAGVGDWAGATDTASRLAGLGPGAPYPAALASWVSGLAAGARRDPSGAVGALGRFDAAVADFARLGMPYEEAVARVDRARVRTAAGHDADAVARDVGDALRVLDRLQAMPQADRARRVLRELGRRPAIASRVREGLGLSGREEEVARLVAQGLTNAEVGERLFISPRTVTTHLQNIYRRLELPSRAALIRYVLAEAPAPDGTPRAADT
ncbi:MAG TPA: AAA family ATPase [Micromonosporaceae bacterium]